MLFMRTLFWDRDCPYCGGPVRVPSLSGGWATCINGHKSAVIRRRGKVWLEKMD